MNTVDKIYIIIKDSGGKYGEPSYRYPDKAFYNKEEAQEYINNRELPRDYEIEEIELI